MVHITVTTTPPRKQFVVTSSTTGPFAFTFNYFDEDELFVYVDTSGVPLPPSAYTLTPGTAKDNGWEGGSITLDSAVSNTIVTIVRAQDISRETDFVLGGPFNVDTLNTWLDKFTALLQELDERLDRTLRADENEDLATDSISLVLPTLVADYAFVVNEAGDGISLSEQTFDDYIADATAQAASAAAFASEAGDYATEAGTEAAAAAGSASSASGFATEAGEFATEAGESASASAGSAASAASSASAAASSASAASSSASAASSSASAAAASASAASGSASAASSSAASAAAAQTAAETAQAAAETAETAAEAAQALAEAAQTGAETAETNAETAETNAETAQGLAETAQAAAEAAQTAAEAAQALAEAAQAAAEAASDNPAATYTYDSTTADADPGAGVFRLNNANPQSATQIFIDLVDDDANTLTGWLDSMDDSTNATGKGTLHLRGIDDPSDALIARVTAVTTATGYRKLTITPLAGTTSFGNGDRFSIFFAATGDRGADGAGSGDVVGPGSSVAGNLATFDDTTGALLADSGLHISDVAFGDEGGSVAGNIAEFASTDGVGISDSGTSVAAILALIPADISDLDDVGSLSADGYLRVNEAGTAVGMDAGPVGLHTIWIPAVSMVPRTSNGPATGSTESTTNKVMAETLDFDAAADEFAQFTVAMPKSWNEGTVTAQFVWRATATGNVVWGIQGLARSDDDAWDTAFGTAQTTTDGVTATTDVMISPATSAMTLGGTPAENDLAIFQVYRDADNGADTCTVDALLIGVRLLFTTNAPTDD